jgi:hypothetical protein
MRIWSIHPACLDSRGLVAAWREGLLALKVLSGGTKGYVHHPQLARFRATEDPIAHLCRYLSCLADEADARGWNFDRTKIPAGYRIANGSCPADRKPGTLIPVPKGQLEYERALLELKLSVRDPDSYARLAARKVIPINDAFCRSRGGIEPWEKVREDVLARMLLRG